MNLNELKRIIKEYDREKRRFGEDRLRKEREEEKRRAEAEQQRIDSGRICCNCCYWFNDLEVEPHPVCLLAGNFISSGKRPKTLDEVIARLIHWKATDSCEHFTKEK